MIEFKPFLDRMLVKRIKMVDRKSAGGIDMPGDQAWQGRQLQGVVIAVGDGRWVNGKHVPVSFFAGDHIFYRPAVESIMFDDASVYDVVVETNVLAYKRMELPDDDEEVHSESHNDDGDDEASDSDSPE